MHSDLSFVRVKTNWNLNDEAKMWMYRAWISLFLLKIVCLFWEKWMTQSRNVDWFKVKQVSWEKPWSWASLPTVEKHLSTTSSFGTLYLWFGLCHVVNFLLLLTSFSHINLFSFVRLQWAQISVCRETTMCLDPITEHNCEACQQDNGIPPNLPAALELKDEM